MNKIPLPFRLVISVVAIAALGIGSFFVVGAIVNPPPAAVAEPAETQVVPVYAPTSYGELDDESSAVADDSEPNAPVGSIEVVTGGTDGAAADADLDALLASMAASGSVPDGDAEDLLTGEDLGVHIVGRDPLRDPCAPVEGAAPADCPEGMRSTVLALLMVPEPTVVGRPYPTVSSYPGQPQCRRVEVAANEVPFGVRTNSPADITVTYWPVADPGLTQTLTLRTSEFETRTWNSELETSSEFSSWWADLDHCGVLSGVTRGIEYAYDIVALDDRGRTFSQATAYFVAGESGDEPLPMVFGAFIDTFIATVPHRANEIVDIRAWWFDPLSLQNSCDSGPDIGGELNPVRRPATWETSEASLAYNNYDLEFTRVTTEAFKAPEGSRIMVCIRWFDHVAPSWDEDPHLRQTSATLSSPDLLIPTFSFGYIRHDSRIDANAVSYTISTIEDESCGRWVGPSAAELDHDRRPFDPGRRLLCDGAALPGHNWTADSVVLLEGQVAGEGATRPIAIDLGVDQCAGTCELPPVGGYVLETVVGGDEVSTMALSVTWTQGRQNGLRWWLVGELLYEEGSALPEFAQLDTDAELRVIDEGGVAGIQFDLRADRPATFTARVSGDCFGDENVREVSGSAPGDGTSQTVTFSDLCRGSVYWVEVQLTDATGTTVFSPYVPTAVWNSARTSANWAGGQIEIDPVTADLTVSVRVQPIPGRDRVMEVEAALLVGYRNVDLGIPEDGCMTVPFQTGPILLDDIELRENVRVLLTFRQSGGGDFAGGVPACEDGERGAFMVVSTSIPLADLLAGTVRIGGGPDYPTPSPYVYEISIQRR